MASSAEELASGAMELERVISYFKTEEKELQTTRIGPTVIETQKPVKKPTAKKTSPLIENKGINLDLGKENIADTDFESF